MIIVLVLTGALSLVVLYGIRLLSTARRLVGFAVIAVAGAGIVLVWDPDLSTRLANLVGVGRGTDLLVYLLFILTAMLVLRSEEHTSELQSHLNLVCRLLL